jgi:ABC-type sugar transport system permease subunit
VRDTFARKSWLGGVTKGEVVGVVGTTLLSVLISLAVIGGLFTGANFAVDRLSTKSGERIRPWIFVGPALLLLTMILVVPAVRTIFLSFRSGKRGEKGFTFDNFAGEKGVFRDKSVFTMDGFFNIFTSRLFIASIVLMLLGIAVARYSAVKNFGGASRLDVASPGAAIALIVAVIALLLGVFSTLSGVIWNNLWWVAAVTGLSTVFGLALAVLADRSRNEKWAKTLIFMPMAISMVGAAVIWKYMYDIKNPVQSPGLLNAIVEFLGFKSTDFLRSARLSPWNNFFIMIIMIWIQTGFAMTVLSAAIKGVPSELLEAARVDGATEVQVFWRVTLPQITSTIAVVVTTLIVSVMKVFDLVKATTGGNVKTDVLANRMYENLKNGNFTMSSTFAVIILVLILPVMYYNIRQTRKEVR